MDNVRYLLKVSDISKPFDVGIVDNVDGEQQVVNTFPINFRIDYNKEQAYIISIEKSLLNNNKETIIQKINSNLSDTFFSHLSSSLISPRTLDLIFILISSLNSKRVQQRLEKLARGTVILRVPLISV